MNTTQRPAGASGATRALVISACLLGCLLAGCASKQAAPASADEATRADASARVLPGFYRVGSGDTLASIGAAFGRDAASLARWNGLSATAELEPGRVLRVAPPPDDGKPPRIKSPQAGANNAACSTNGLSWPVSGAVLTAFDGKHASGMTIGGKSGDAVKVARSGRVVYTGSSIKGYGLLIIVKHDESLLTAYGYNQRVLVKEGDKVKRGQAIAEMGKTPNGKPALLFEVRKDRKPVDPAPYLKRCES
ncbi:peptidase M23B [Caballeronia hypogeia]|uniref:Peptidase M23B n=1 Tax=Caballeronia hypogeia TaxID=1777140 RepID=A0A158CFZ5_9BURK|nr:peptidoglycan DD-metalloendopeptidase family protein [Caballeronia hypogeia]SAK81298.1 peptidase M23B [Caballeronia hypogeia]